MLQYHLVSKAKILQQEKVSEQISHNLATYIEEQRGKLDKSAFDVLEAFGVYAGIQHLFLIDLLEEGRLKEKELKLDKALGEKLSDEDKTLLSGLQKVDGSKEKFYDDLLLRVLQATGGEKIVIDLESEQE